MGIVPGSVGLFVVDVDEGGSAAVQAVVGLLGAVRSKRAHGRHLYYPAPQREVRNRKWRMGPGGGEVRGTRGYVILWDNAAEAVAGAIKRAPETPAVDPDELPGLGESRCVPLDQVPRGSSEYGTQPARLGGGGAGRPQGS